MRDSLEPLGQHHDRGFILPFAVAPVAGNGELAGRFHPEAPRAANDWRMKGEWAETS